MKSRDFPAVDQQSGFSLVELMVALVIGLVSTLVLMQVGVTFEDQRKTTLGSGDTIDASAVAVNSLRNSLQMAGFGLNAPPAVGCNLTIYRESNATTTNFALTPVAITQGAPGANDTIDVRAADFRRYSDSRLRASHPGDATGFPLETIFGFSVGDVFLLTHMNNVTPCNLGEVTGVVPFPNGEEGQVLHQSGVGARFNRPGGNGVAYNYISDSNAPVIYNLGPQPSFLQFRVANGRLQRVDLLTGATTDILDDVITLQAQFGFMRATGDIVWSDTVFDANGQNGAGDDGDWARLIAVRVALVVRHGKMEKPDAANQCDTTPGNVTWSFDSLDISGLPDGRCYRYRVIETVVPMRNLMWGQ